MKQYVCKIYGENIHYCESETPFWLTKDKASRYWKRLIDMCVPFAIEHLNGKFAIVLKQKGEETVEAKFDRFLFERSYPCFDSS